MLVVFGKYSGSGAAAAKITGTFNGKTREFTADVSFPAQSEESAFIPRMWATRRVGWLLDEMRMHGESAELKDEVTSLARRFGIVTPYTAYLILEDEAQRDVPVLLRSFQEMEEDRGAMSAAREKVDSVRMEAASEARRAGASAVENSIAVQDMKSSLNEQQAAQPLAMGKTSPASPAGATTAAGGGYKAAQAQNYATQVRVLNGRAFYQNGNLWTDSTAQGKRSLKQKSIQFGSEAYFGFLKSNPQAAQWLALGANVDVVVNDTLYSIRE
jgi:Ca-activated chloride channel family protein